MATTTVMYGSGALLLYLVAARALGGQPRDDRTPLSWIDLLLGAIAAACTGLGAAWWMPAYHMRGFPLSGSDFAQYCDVVIAALAGRADMHPHRGWAGAVVPALLARDYGVIGGLALSSALSLWVYGAALYIWGRAVHGRVAGLAAALLALTLSPLVLMARTTSFYPQGVALTAMACATAALCLRAPGLLTALACGAACGLALLVEVRAVFWVLAALGVAVIGLLRARSARGLVGLAMLAVPLWVSYQAAARLPTKGITGLDRQTWSFVQVAMHQLPQPPAPPPAPETDFWWGRNGLRDLPNTLRQTREMMDAVPATVASLPVNVRYRREQVHPWRLPVMGAAVIALAGALRRPWALVGLLPLIAYALSLRTAVQLFHLPRYTMAGAAGVPLVLGLAWATVTEGRRGLLPRALRPWAVLALLVTLVLGMAPSFLSPVAPWRRPFYAEEYPRAVMMGQTEHPDDARCVATHAADEAAGRRFLWSQPVTVRQDRRIDPDRDLNPSGAAMPQLPGRQAVEGNGPPAGAPPTPPPGLPPPQHGDPGAPPR